MTKLYKFLKTTTLVILGPIALLTTVSWFHTSLTTTNDYAFIMLMIIFDVVYVVRFFIRKSILRRK